MIVNGQEVVMMTKKQVQANLPNFGQAAFREHLSGFRERIIIKAARELANGRDIIIKNAIGDFLGEDGVDFDKLSGRGEFIVTPDKREVFSFDGTPLVEFYPVKPIAGERNKFSAGFNYRLLYHGQ